MRRKKGCVQEDQQHRLGGTGGSMADHAGVAMASIVRMSSSVGKVNKKIAVQ
jgi:hypothetical protein